MRRSDLLLGLGRRLMLLLCFFIVGYALTVGLSLVLGKILVGNPAAFLRITTVLQDICVFILPALATACIICRKPAELLALMKSAGARAWIAIGVILFVSIPAIEAVIYWNANLHFPSALAAFEAGARAMEATASAMTESMLRSNTSTIGLILNLLIIGVFAGFSEELLFRGCFQRILTTGGVNPHLAIWLVAAVFSGFHFQVFGFVPRLLLGAYFGYLLLWTGSVRASMLAHILNNSLYVVAAWSQLLHNPDAPLQSDSAGELYPPALIVLSIAATTAALVWLYIGSRARKQKFANSGDNS